MVYNPSLTALFSSICNVHATLVKTYEGRPKHSSCVGRVPGIEKHISSIRLIKLGR